MRELRKNNTENYFHLLNIKKLNIESFIYLLLFYKNFYRVNELELFKKVVIN